MRDTITLGFDPFSAEYFGRFTALTESIGPLLGGGTRPYVAYLMERRAKKRVEPDREYCEQRALTVRAMTESIRDDGYDPEAWKTCGRNLDYSRGQGPITINIGADGTIYSWDGLHRSAILRHLGRPVVAEVYRRDKRWEELRAFHKTLYQPYPHPDLADRKVIRPGGERYQAIAAWIDSHCLDEMTLNALMVGACTGFGLLALSQSMNACGIEPSAERFELLRSLAAKTNGVISEARMVSAADYESYNRHAHAIGLSVYHHVASSIEQWAKVCEKLAACPVQILELPGDHEKQWHDKFREETHGQPKEALIGMLTSAGEYTERETIYVDGSYASRQTIALWRGQQ